MPGFEPGPPTPKAGILDQTRPHPLVKLIEITCLKIFVIFNSFKIEDFEDL